MHSRGVDERRSRHPSKVIKRSLGATITFKKAFIPKILKNTKTVTVRWGIVKPSRRLVLIESEGLIYGEAEIKNVKVTHFSQLDEECASKDGFNGVEELKSALKRIYPSIEPDDLVTVLEFEVKELFKSPVPRDLLFARAGRLARLALARGLYASAGERQALAHIAAGKDVVEASMLAGVPVGRVVEVLLEARKFELDSR
jgi:hypothetical protein